jgi:hypothetical protein
MAKKTKTIITKAKRKPASARPSTRKRTSRRIRKQVYELTDQDLDRYPVWEFALDEEGEEEQDEATVRPYHLRGALDASAGMFIVRARLTLADGTRMIGYLTPPVQGDSGLGKLQPAVAGPAGQVSFWCGVIAPEPAVLAQCYRRLGRRSGPQVFPVRFESDVALVGGPVSGEVPGFLVLEDFKTGRTRVVA